MKNRIKTLCLASLLTLALAPAPALAQSVPSPSKSPVPLVTASIGPEVLPSASPGGASPSAANPNGYQPLNLNPLGSGDASLLEVGGADMSSLNERYSSLSGALAAMYADKMGLSVAQYIEAKPLEAAQLLGVQTPQALAELPVGELKQTNGKVDVTALNRQLAASGYALNTKGYTDMNKVAAGVAKNSSGADAAVIAAGSNWAKQMTSLRAGTLKAPGAPGVNTALATQMPKEGLAFGLFLNKSLTAMVADFPDVFSQVQKTGLGTSSSQAAWNTSMQRALASSRPDFNSMLPSKCAAGMLSVMASGNPKDAKKYGDSSGAAAGLYLNSQLSRLFDPGSASTLPNPSDNVINPTEWNRLQDFQKRAILAQNPDLGKALQAGVSGSKTTGCTSSSAATSGALSTTLPGVFSNLMK